MRTMKLRAFVIVLWSVLIGGCLNEKAPSSLVITPTPNENSAPTISGTPATTTIEMGSSFDFQPNATDSDGDTLVFTIAKQPSWTRFESTTGRLDGTPSLGDIGVSSDIVISVSDGVETVSLTPFSITVVDSSSGSNNAPTISGTPTTSIAVNSQYSFQPAANDADGDPIRFTIQNQPAWTTFDATSGQLSGTPQAGMEGSYQNIVISVTDEIATSSLPPFSIMVTQVSNGSVTLNWTAPTEMEDGTAMTDLAGYKVYYGTAPGSYGAPVRIDNPGLTTYVVDNLSPNTYYFVTTAFTPQGAESVFSNEVSKMIN
jgi:Putative Ig domain